MDGVVPRVICLVRVVFSAREATILPRDQAWIISRVVHSSPPANYCTADTIKEYKQAKSPSQVLNKKI